MLAKALGGSILTAHFSQTLKAFEAEDKRAHRGRVVGEVDIDRFEEIMDSCSFEWRHAFDEQHMHRIVATTKELPTCEEGLVAPGGALRYRTWLAAAAATAVCGGEGRREFADYADWITRHGCVGIMK